MNAREKATAQIVINEIWKAMVKGFQDIDPSLATQWDARQPAPFVDSKTGNHGLSMHCNNLKLSFVVEKNMESGIYLLTAAQDGKPLEPITALQDSAMISKTLVEWVATNCQKVNQ